METFFNRVEAGRKLANLLTAYRGHTDVVVLGLPRGGVPVAFEVARALGAPLDVMIVRKLGAPRQPELAVGAIASGGVTVVNESVAGFIDPDVLARIAAQEAVELARREHTYRGTRHALNVHRRTVILVDDGAATGATMLAAVRATRKLGASMVIVALPVASREARDSFVREADQVVCVTVPADLQSVGEWYDDFTQTTDAEVTDLLSAPTGSSGEAAGTT